MFACIVTGVIILSFLVDGTVDHCGWWNLSFDAIKHGICKLLGSFLKWKTKSSKPGTHYSNILHCGSCRHAMQHRS